MEIKLLMNLLFSLTGIFVFYLSRRVKINKKMKKILGIIQISSKKIIIVLIGVILFILGILIELVLEILKICYSFASNVLAGHPDDYKFKFGSGVLLEIKKNFLKIYREELYRFEKERLKNNSSILDMLINEKSKRNENMMIVISIYMILNYYLYVFVNVNIQYVVFVLLTALVWLIVIYQIVLIYRSKNGYYGTNYEEAKEIIYFTKKLSDDDINMSGGPKILNEIENQDSVTNGQKAIV